MMRARGGWNKKCLPAEEVHYTVLDRLLILIGALCSNQGRIIYDNAAYKVLAALFGHVEVSKGKPSCVLDP